jgi:hypothetical protein
MLQTISNLYTKQNSKWIKDLDKSFAPIVLNKWLLMNDRLLPYTLYLDKFSFVLEDKHWLALAWATLPKTSQAPFVKYIKKVEEDDIIYDSIFIKIRRILDIGDNDFQAIKHIIKKIIDDDKEKWFRVLGMKEDVWVQHGLSYNMSTGEIRQGKSGLELFGL